MKDKQSIERAVFDRLIKAIEEKYKNDCPADKTPMTQNKWGNKDAHTPIGKKPENPKSIREIMLCDDTIQQELARQTDEGSKTISPKRLYEFQNISKKEKESATLTRQTFDVNICLCYLGYDSLQAFASLPEMTGGDKDKKEELSPNFYYKSYYYSYKSHKVKHFLTTFTKVGTGIYDVVEEGWHDEAEEEVHRKYHGRATRQGNFLFVNLTNSGNNRAIHMTVVAGTEAGLQHCPFLRANFTAISTHHLSNSVEVIMVACNEKGETKLEGWQTRILERYLVLKMNNFSIRNEHWRSAEDFRTVKHKDSRVLRNFVTTWRIWSYSRSGKIYQSFMNVYPEYRAFYYSSAFKEKNHNKQVCLLKFSATEGKIALSTHPFEKTGVLSYCIINSLDDNELVTEGGFLSGGNALPIISYMVLKKEDSLSGYFDENDDENIKEEGKHLLKLGLLTESEIAELVKADNHIRDMYARLTTYMDNLGIQRKEVKRDHSI